MRKIASLISFLVLTFTLQAEIGVSFRRIEQAIAYKNIWDLLLTNRDADRKVVVLEGVIISRESGKVYECRTGKFLLNTGQQLISFETLPPMDIFFVRPDDNQLFKDGQYDIVVRVLSFPGLQILAEAEYTLSKTGNDPAADSSSRNGKFGFNIDINFSGQYAHTFRDDTLRLYPDYARLQVTPQVTLYEIPFIADIFVSTDNTEGLLRGSDQFNVRFDYNKYKAILLQKSYERLNAIAGQKIPFNDSILQQVNAAYLEKQLPGSEDIVKQLEDPDILKQIKAYDNLEQFKSTLDRTGMGKKLTTFRKELAQYGLSGSGLLQASRTLKEVDLDQIMQFSALTGIDTILPGGQQRYRQLYDQLRNGTVDSSLLNKVKDPEKLYRDLGQLSKLSNEIAGKDLVAIQKKYGNISQDELKRLSDIDAQLMQLERTAEKYAPVERSGIRKKNKKLVKDIDRVEKLSQYNLRDIESAAREMGIKKQLDTTSNPALVLMQLYDTLSVMQDLGQLRNIEDPQKLLTDVRSLSRMGSSKLPGKWKDLSKVQKQFSKINTEELAQIKDISHQIKTGKIKEKALDARQLKKLRKHADLVRQYKNANLEKLLQDPASAKSLDDAFGLLSKKEKILSSFKGLELGTTMPNFSDLTLNGAIVRGASVLYDDSKIYLGVTGGKLENFNYLLVGDSTLNQDRDSTGKHSVFGLSAGWGSKESSFVHVNYLLESGKIHNSIYDENSNKKQHGHILSVDFGYNILNNKIRLLGEVARYLSRDLENGSMPYAAYGAANIELGRSGKKPFLLTGTFRYLGKDYYSGGIPLMIKDRLSYEIRTDKKLFRDLFTVSVFYNEDQVNRSREDKYQRFNTLGGSVLFSKVKWPYVQVSLSRILSNQHREWALETNSTNYNLNLNAGYDFKLKQQSLSSQFSYSNIFQRLQDGNIVNYNSVYVIYSGYDYMQTHQFAFRQSLRTKGGIDIQASCNLLFPGDQKGELRNIQLYELNSTFQIIKRLRNTVGIQYMLEAEKQKRLGFFIQSIININKFIKFNMHVQNDLSRLNKDINSGNWIESIMFRTVLNIRI